MSAAASPIDQAERAAPPVPLERRVRLTFRSSGRFLPFLARNPGFLGAWLRAPSVEMAYLRWVAEASEKIAGDALRQPGPPTPALLAQWARDRRTRRTRLGNLGGRYYVLLYLTIRRCRPHRVVETGVATGFSTGLILTALERNGDGGTLTSLDLPFQTYQQEDGTTTSDDPTLRFAAFVPSKWRAGTGPAWTLVVGDTRQELPRLFSSSPPPDVFVHDSGHTEEIMAFEYALAWEHLSRGGLLLSDDIGFNGVFPKFSRTRGQDAFADERFGYLRKEGGADPGGGKPPSTAAVASAP